MDWRNVENEGLKEVSVKDLSNFFDMNYDIIQPLGLSYGTQFVCYKFFLKPREKG